MLKKCSAAIITIQKEAYATCHICAKEVEDSKELSEGTPPRETVYPIYKKYYLKKCNEQKPITELF